MGDINDEIIRSNFGDGKTSEDETITIVQAEPSPKAKRRRLIMIVASGLMALGLLGVVLEVATSKPAGMGLGAVTTPPMSVLATSPSSAQQDAPMPGVLPGPQGTPSPAAAPAESPSGALPPPAEAPVSGAPATSPAFSPPAQAPAAQPPSTLPPAAPAGVDHGELAKLKEAVARAEERARLADERARVAEDRLKTAEKPKDKLSAAPTVAPKDAKLPVQFVSMKEAGILAVLTDGLIVLKNGEEREVNVGDFAPMLRGKIVRTSPTERFVWTTEKLYKLN